MLPSLLTLTVACDLRPGLSILRENGHDPYITYAKNLYSTLVQKLQ